jgi:hypothetical protein
LVFLAPKDFKIIWLSNILALSVPDEGYSRNVFIAITGSIPLLVDY